MTPLPRKIVAVIGMGCIPYMPDPQRARRSRLLMHIAARIKILLDSIRMYYDENRYSTETLAAIAIEILNVYGHKCEWLPGCPGRLSCRTCDIFYDRWQIIRVFECFALSGTAMQLLEERLRARRS